MIPTREQARRNIRVRHVEPFSPRSLAGLLGWWDAQDLHGLAASDPVSAMRDLSGNGRDATQTNASKRPVYKILQVNGRPAVQFDGTDDALTGLSGINAGSGITYVAVCQMVAASAYGSIVSVGVATGFQELGLMADSAGTHMAISNFWGPTSTAGDRYTTTVNNDWHIASVVYAPSATPVLYKNGTNLAYTSSVGDWSVVNLNNGAANYPFALGAAAGGSSTPSNVRIATAMIYGRALGTNERQRVERWLGARYGITVS